MRMCRGWHHLFDVILDFLVVCFMDYSMEHLRLALNQFSI